MPSTPVPPPPEFASVSEPLSAGMRRFLIGLGTATAIAVLALFVFVTLFDQYQAKSESMLPTVEPDDRVIVRSGAEPNHGDIVVYRKTESLSNLPLLKRVVAVGPDRIDFVNGDVLLNGERLEEPYLSEAGSTLSAPNGAIPGCETSSPSFCVLPEGTVFVLGDNRRASVDSRMLGPVDADDVLGVVVGSW